MDRRAEGEAGHFLRSGKHFLGMMTIRIFEKLQRKKSNDDDGEAGPLARVLTLLDLTALGVGSTLGLGVYVLAGSVAKTIAGPAVCISFLVAAVASAFAALCYAEFAARVPKAGSAYVYSYVTIGEFVAFVIGWNLILEYVIGTASVARGLSNYIDALADNKISEFFIDLLPMDIGFLASYPDFMSFFFVMLLTALLAFGVKESSNLNNVFTLLNLVTITIAIVAGSIKADVHNWNISLDEIDAEHRSKAGTGGFAPFGFTGIMSGAARCFYGFVGFDAIATTGEEAINPQRDIPLSIVISLAIIFGAYFAISTVLTMALPYYLQNADAPFPEVFDYFGWHEIKWVVTIGAIFALCTSLLGAMFPLPRVLYAMSNDGIIFKFLAKVNSYTKTPLVATILSGLLSATMATIFDLEQLIDMMSIGTLLAYSIVAVSVLVLRYEPDQYSEYPGISMKADDESFEISLYNNFKKVFNLHNNKYPSRETSQIVNWSVLLFCIFCTLFCATIANGHSSLFNEAFITVGFVITLIAVLVLLIIMIRQPTNNNLQLSFSVPLVPYIPCLSVLFNLYLMVELDMHTWIRFVVWLFVGFLIYFMYGISHSSASTPEKPQETIQMEKEVTKF